MIEICGTVDRDSIDHLGAVLGDAALLEVRADNVARDVMQEQNDIDLIAQLNELRSFAASLNSVPLLPRMPMG